MEGAVTQPEEQRESKSSVKLTLNAKGDVQIEIKVVAGETEDEVQRVKLIALENFVELRTALGR